jgi:methionine salvage enolase-phosphatase E1
MHSKFSPFIISGECQIPYFHLSLSLSPTTHAIHRHASIVSQQCVVLDIEGTTSPISFVTDVLFPYARDNVRKHLDATYGTDETKDDVALLRAQVEQDLDEGVAGAVPVPPDEAGKDRVIDALVANVEAMIEADRKITSLKQLQVPILARSTYSVTIVLCSTVLLISG